MHSTPDIPNSTLPNRSLVSEQRDRDCLAPLLRLHDLHGHSLTFVERAQPGTLDNCSVEKDVLAAILTANKAKSLVRIVPLHGAFDTGRGRRIRALPPERLR